MREDLDDQYHEYLWGAASPRSFARKTRFEGAKKSSKVVNVQYADVDISSIVPR